MRGLVEITEGTKMDKWIVPLGCASTADTYFTNKIPKQGLPVQPSHSIFDKAF